MTAAQTRILEMFRALTPGERETLLPELAETVPPLSFDDLSPEVKAAIEEGLAQAGRGEAIAGEELFGRLAQKLGFSGE